MTVLRLRDPSLDAALRSGARLRDFDVTTLLFDAVSIVATLEILALEVGRERAVEVLLEMQAVDRFLDLGVRDRQLAISVTTLGLTPRAREGVSQMEQS